MGETIHTFQDVHTFQDRNMIRGGNRISPLSRQKASVLPSARFFVFSHAEISAVLYAFFRALFVINPLQK